MQNRDDVDGSQRPRTADAPEMNSLEDGHLGRGGDPVEGRDPSQPGSTAAGGGPGVSGHLGAGGDAVEGDDDAIEHDLEDVQNIPAKE
jgi:hypothetical protein